MNSDPLLRTGAEILFYVAIGVLIIILIIKKRKQMHLIHEELKDEIQKEENNHPDKLDR